jgi:hypothetical protein
MRQAKAYIVIARLATPAWQSGLIFKKQDLLGLTRKRATTRIVL